MDQKNNQKSILMFCADFFGYDRRIADALRKEGFLVDLFDEKPGTDFVTKACVRYGVKAFRPRIRKYVEKVISSTRKGYDFVLVVKGEAIDEECIRLLRKANPDATFVLYLWDSAANIHDCEKKIGLYDRVFTFDPQDAKKYRIPHLSLPFDEKSFSYSETDSYDYDVAFVGTCHSVRPRVVKEVVRQCNEMGKKTYIFFYSPHILVYLYHKIKNPDFRYLSLKEVHFEPLSNKELHEIYRASRCVLDIEHPKQKGTTTRPVEMLPMKKKIITTNSYVKQFPFFSENNFYIIDRDNVKLSEHFFETPYVEADDEILNLYSPSHFVRVLLDIK